MQNKFVGYQCPKYYKPKKYSESMHINEINELLLKYKEKAILIKEPEWYSKYVALYFTYSDEAYVIYPSDISTSSEKFEVLEKDFADDLYNIGAYDMYCSGMID